MVRACALDGAVHECSAGVERPGLLVSSGENREERGGVSSLRGRIVQAAARAQGPWEVPPYPGRLMGLHGRAQGWESADFASGFVCSANFKPHQQEGLPVPWGQGQCGPPSAVHGKEAPNTEHVKPVGHPPTSTPRPCQPSSSHPTYPFQIHS